MITARKKKEIQEHLRSLAATNALAVEQIEKTISLLTIALELEGAVSPTDEHAIPEHVGNRPMVDYATFSVVWNERNCFLGNTLLFRFFARIARCPNCYVTHLDLLDDVWGGERECTSIRGVAKRLRDRLIECGMEKLANSIDGSVAGHYGLILV